LTKEKRVSQETLIKTFLQPKQPSIKQGMPVNKKRLLKAIIFQAFLTSALAGVQLVNSVMANPFIDYQSIPAPFKPTINISSPEGNNTLHNLNKMRISFNASVESTAQIWTVYYRASWQQENVTIYQYGNPGSPVIATQPALTEYSRTLEFPSIPEGKQTVTITVRAEGGYAENMVYYSFSTVDSCTVGFIIDTVPPDVSVAELDNKTFVEPNVPLNFTINESFSKISYVLDNQENLTIGGNTTLTGLSYGVHNVTAYAWDEAGNAAASETVYFTIMEPEPEPFPTLFVGTVSVGAIALVGASLIIYFKKRKR
jgi:hypothetical protein